MKINHGLTRQAICGLLICLFSGSIAQAAEADTTSNILTEMEHHRNWVQNREKILALGPKETPVLRAYFKNPHSESQVRSIALEAIYRSNKTDATRAEIREACLNDADKQFRSACYMMMGRTKDPAFANDYMKALDNPKELASVQVMSAMGLAILGDRRGYKRAMQSIQKPDGSQDFAMMTLEFLKARDALPVLESTLKGTTNYQTVNACRQAILRINLIDKSPDEQIPLLEQALTEDGYFDVRAWASRKLAFIGTENAGKALSRVSKNQKLPGSDVARRGLLSGVQEKHWTNEDIKRWQ